MLASNPNRPCVYILASRRNGTLYTGVTSEIGRRGWTHKAEAIEGFTKRYAVHRLVYVEFHETMRAAIVRENQIKKWRRAWKLQLIEEANPQWRDLFDDLLK
jgi:putative endonuclease